MRDAPLTANLIATAREELKSAVLPKLSGDAAYVGAMIANALGIALRDLENDESDDSAERAHLRDLFGSDADDLTTLNAEFARALRAGRFDPGQGDHDAARHILRIQTRARLARVKPEALAAWDERLGAG